MLQSQYGLTEYLKNHIDNLNQLKWEDYLGNIDSFDLKTEIESIDIIEKNSSTILSNFKLKNKLYLDFVNLINIIPDINKQNLFISQVGLNGAKEIVDILSKKWKL
jgi:hypothetical protein